MPKIIKFSDIRHPGYKDWLGKMKDWLEDQWGLSDELAERTSVFLLYASLLGISWTVASGYRNPDKQKALRAQWDSGNTSGLAAKPAINSKHTTETWYGSAAAEAVDINSENLYGLGELAPYFGLKWGGNFRTPDLVHFFI